MQIYSLSRAFWDFSFENPQKINTNHVAVYFFALEHCNRLGWKEVFGLPTSVVMDAVGIKSYSVYKKTFDELCELGFFKVIQLSKNQYTANIIALKEIYEANGKANNKAPLKALDKALVSQSSKHILTHSEYNNTIDNIQVTSNNIDTNVSPVLQPEPQSLFDLKAEYRKVNKSDKQSLMQFFSANKPNFIEPYVDLWNVFAADFNMPMVKVVSDARKRKLNSRVRNKNFNMLEILKAASKSKFIKEGNFFNFDWIIENDVNYVKVIEGNYK